MLLGKSAEFIYENDSKWKAYLFLLFLENDSKVIFSLKDCLVILIFFRS